MNCINLFLSACVFFIQQSRAASSCCGDVDYSKFPEAQVNFFNDTILELNHGWQQFFFGNSSSWALARPNSAAFYTNYKVPIVVRIVDSFKPGDRFALYLNGSFFGNTTIGDSNSTVYTTYPNESWLNANYSRGEWILPPGLHRFTIKTLNSVDLVGNGAFIRADVNPSLLCGDCRPLCKADGPCKCSPFADPNNPPGCCANNPPKMYPACQEASGKFLMIKGQFTRDQGIEACNRLNLRLAEITSANFDGVNQFAYVCNGNQVAESWIRSWNGDFYDDACLVLSSGSFGGTGAINVLPCKSKNFVICQA